MFQMSHWLTQKGHRLKPIGQKWYISTISIFTKIIVWAQKRKEPISFQVRRTCQTNRQNCLYTENIQLDRMSKMF